MANATMPRKPDLALPIVGLVVGLAAMLYGVYISYASDTDQGLTVIFGLWISYIIVAVGLLVAGPSFVILLKRLSERRKNK